jgi:hypothetical protein
MNIDLLAPLRRAVEKVSEPAGSDALQVSAVRIIEQEVREIINMAHIRGVVEAYPQMRELVLLLRILMKVRVCEDRPYDVRGFLVGQLGQVREWIRILERGDKDSRDACWTLGCVIAAALKNLGVDIPDFQLPPAANAA